MRGTLQSRVDGAHGAGIIPAYAGNTWTGEGSSESVTGSSPRMRGTHVGWKYVCANMGIIPAYAGNTRRAG